MDVIQLDKDIVVCNTFLKRLKGLLGTTELSIKLIYLFYPCSQVHTFFMQYTIFCIYCDRSSRVIWKGKLDPWKLGPYKRSAYYVIETTDETLYHNVSIGTVLNFHD